MCDWKPDMKTLVSEAFRSERRRRQTTTSLQSHVESLLGRVEHFGFIGSQLRFIDIEYILDKEHDTMRDDVLACATAHMFLQGACGVTQKRDVGLQILHRLADENKFPHAMANLGNIYFHGLFGVPRNRAQGIEYWELGSQKSAECMFRLGQVLLDTKDRIRGHDLISGAAVLGHRNAMKRLGDEYFARESPEYARRAVQLWQQATDLGCSSACFALSQVFRNGRLGIEKDLDRARSLEKKASDLAVANSCMCPVGPIAAVDEDALREEQEHKGRETELDEACDGGGGGGSGSGGPVSFWDRRGCENPVKRPTYLDTVDLSTEIGRTVKDMLKTPKV